MVDPSLMTSTMADNDHNAYYHMLTPMASLISLKVGTLPSFDLVLNNSARRGLSLDTFSFSRSLDKATKMMTLVTPYQYF